MKEISIVTSSRTDFVEITEEIQTYVKESGLNEGLATVYVPHTTAGVTINENADADVMRDMEIVLDRMVPWEGGYLHNEGNTASHVKTSMMGSSAQVLVSGGRLQLGTWQGIFFCEFDGPRTRKIWLTGTRQ